MSIAPNSRPAPPTGRRIRGRRRSHLAVILEETCTQEQLLANGKEARICEPWRVRLDTEPKRAAGALTMLTSFSVTHFKSLFNVRDLQFGRLTLFFGPNAVGKSNLLDALQVYSRLATSDTAADALASPVRGLPLETLTFPVDGLPGILAAAKDAGNDPRASRDFSFRVEGVLESSGQLRFRYGVEVGISPLSGAVTIQDEVLQRLSRRELAQGKAVIERVGDSLTIRRKSKPAHPWSEEAGANHTQLSNRRYSGKEYALMDAARQELASFRSYYLDPRLAMRSAQPPQEVDDIGVNGEHIAPFLYRLKAEKPRAFEAVERTLRTVIPSIERLSIELDNRRGVLDIEIRQNGTPFSSRVVSEGTLRVLGLACVAVNPWGGSLIAFEEPENGVHPRRIELVAQMMASLAAGKSGRQVVLTTHSPILCGAILKLVRDGVTDIKLYTAVQDSRFSEFLEFEATGPLFEEAQVREALTTPDEVRVFQELQLRGFFDAA
jgi:predicted ATPase